MDRKAQINNFSDQRHYSEMRFDVSILSCMLQGFLTLGLFGQISMSDAILKFRSKLAAKVQDLEKENASALLGENGWLFLSAELRFVSIDRFWGNAAPKVSRSSKPELADPLPAIVDFHNQLADRGIHLLLVPVPAKAVIYPETIVPEYDTTGGDPDPFLSSFYDELRGLGVDVLDLAPLFRENRHGTSGNVFCKTDTHWSGVGCVLAAQAIAKEVRSKFISLPPPSTNFASEWRDATINGDLNSLLPQNSQKTGAENIRVREVREIATGSGIESDSNSPVLLIGDSFTLVFHDFLTARAGLIDQLALEMGIIPDLIGTRGSGATAVRISLYRRTAKDPDYLPKKKVIIWCFNSDEFTETAQGWQKLPVAK